MAEDPVVADLDKVDQLIMLTLDNRPFDRILGCVPMRACCDPKALAEGRRKELLDLTVQGHDHRIIKVPLVGMPMAGLAAEASIP